MFLREKLLLYLGSLKKVFSGKMLLKCLNNAYHFRFNKMLKESGVLTQRFLEDWFNSGTALLMKCNFLSFFSRRFIVLPIFGDPGAGLSEWDDFFLSSCSWISGDDYHTYITQRNSTVTGLWYRTFVVQHPPSYV